jgi:hypothetical protein
MSFANDEFLDSRYGTKPKRATQSNGENPAFLIFI